MESQGLWSQTLIDNMGALAQTFPNQKSAAAAAIVYCIIQWAACFIFPVGIHLRAGGEIYYKETMGGPAQNLKKVLRLTS